MNMRLTVFTVLRVLLWLIIFFASPFTSQSHAISLTTDEKEFLRAKDIIVFVSQTRYPPFEFTDANRQHEGMMLDVVRWLAVEIGFKPVFADMAFKDAQKAVLSGGADVLTSLFHSEKRSEIFQFSETLFDVPASIFVKSERTDIKDIADLNGKTIAIQRGDYAKEFLESQHIPFQTLDTQDFAEAVDMVSAGKADAVIGDEQIVFYHIFNNRLTEKVKKVGEPLYIGNNCMATNKANAILIDIFNKAIREARKTGVLDKISQKWLGTQYGSSKWLLGKYLWPLLIIAGCLLLVIFGVWVWNIRLRDQVKKKTDVIVNREKALRESEENFRVFFETVEDLVFVADREGKILFTNPAVSLKIGYHRDQLRRMRILDVHSPEDREEAETILAEMFKGERDVCPLPLQTNSGNLIPVETRVWFGRWDGSDCIFGISKDLTKEQEALQKFNLLFHNNPALMAVSGLVDKKFTDVNDAFLTTLGYSREEVIGKTSAELKLFVEPEKQENIALQLLTWGRIINCELQVRCKNGTILDGLFSGVVLSSQGDRFFLTVMIDQTERKRAEAQLFESEYKFKSFAEQAIAGIYLIQDGVYKYVNPTFARMFGYSVEECLNGLLFEKLVYAEDIPIVKERVGQRIAGASSQVHYMFRGLKKHGEVFHVEVYGSAVGFQGKPAAIGTILDITERRKADQALQNALREKEVLLREIHHRVKNNMQVINSLLNLQVERIDNDEVRRALVENQQRLHAMSMIHQTLYSGQNLSTVDLSSYLKGLVHYLEGVYKTHADVRIVLELEKLTLGIDQAVPCGLILNELITNAFKHAFPAGSQGIIRVKGQLADNEEVILAVSDSGVGISEDLDIEAPTSLGLKLVQGLLKYQLKGSMEVLRNGGVTFLLRWPLMEKEADDK